jgi:flagellar hook assembly protein FlgD
MPGKRVLAGVASFALVTGAGGVPIELNLPPSSNAFEVTLVVEDAAGRRVRNLASGLTWRQGDPAPVWDGLDDAGQPVPPGEYR